MSEITIVRIREQLYNLYYKEELIEHKKCEHFKQCEFGCKTNNSDRYLLEPVGAFVGNNYLKNRILFMGINTNGAGGINAMYHDKEFSNGLEWSNHKPFKEIHKLLKFHFTLNDEYLNDIAFLNIIKCSWVYAEGSANKGGRSEPPWIQWVNCVHKKQLLNEELSIIEPSIIFTLGESVYRELQIKFFAKHYKEIIKNHLFSFDLDRKMCFVAKLPHLSNLISVNRQMKEFRNGKFPHSYKPIFDYLKPYNDGNEIILKDMEKMLTDNYPEKVLDNAINDLVDFSVFAQRKALNDYGIMIQGN